MTRQTIVALLIVVAAATAAAVWTIRHRPALQVTQATVTTGPIAHTLLALGTIVIADPQSASEAAANEDREDPGLRHMQVEAVVDERDLNQLRLFETAMFTPDVMPHESFRGVFSIVKPIPPTHDAPSVPAGPAATVSQVEEEGEYLALVDVDTPDARLTPGMTAIVALPGDFRANALRIPNGALSFEPPAGTLRAPVRDEAASRAAGRAAPVNALPRRVWTFDGTRFTPVPVALGLSDDQWTELLGGFLHAGDRLVTGADVERRSGL